MVTSKQSPHLPLPLTSFGPQGHEIPEGIQPRIKKTQKMWGHGMKRSRRRRDSRARRTSQSSVKISARLPLHMCMQFCSVLLVTCEEELFDNTRVLVSTLCFQEHHTEAYKSSMLPFTRSFRVRRYYSECLEPQRIGRHRNFLSRSRSGLGYLS